MVSSLEEVNGIIRDTVHQAVFLVDTTGPATCQHVSKRLGLSQPLEWIPHHCIDEIQHSDCGAAFGFDPKTEVLPELRLKHRDPFRISLHLRSLDAVPRPFQAWSALAPLVVMPIGDAVRCVATVTGVQFPGDRRVRWPEEGRRRALPAAERSRFPAGPPPDRERWPDFYGGWCTSFHSA